MSDDALEPLSPHGEVRRRDILADALRAADRRRGRRTRLVAGVVAFPACAAALLVLPPLSRQRPASVVGPISPPTAQTELVPLLPAPPSLIAIRPAPAAPAVHVEIIPADAAKGSSELLSDDQFIRALADAGQPSGLARLNGKTVVVPIQ